MANIASGHPGMTGTLKVRYLSPTPLHRRWSSGRTERVEGRRIVSQGRADRRRRGHRRGRGTVRDASTPASPRSTSDAMSRERVTADQNDPMSSIGLVLGAGGLTGQAFHAGVLAGIAEASGWDPATADLVVGTSAGAGMGLYLRLGITPADMLARLEETPLTPAGQAVVDSFGEPGDWTQPTVAREWRPPNPQLLGKLLRTPWKVRPEALLGVAIPTGRMDTELWTSAIREGAGTIWPTAPLWISAVRMDDAHRVVFGREGAPHTDVADRGGRELHDPRLFRAGDHPRPSLRRRRRALAHERRRRAQRGARPRDRVVADVALEQREPAQAVARVARALPRPARHRDPQAAPRRACAVARVPAERGRPASVMGNQAMDDDRMVAVARQARETTLRRLTERPLDIGREAAASSSGAP